MRSFSPTKRRRSRSSSGGSESIMVVYDDAVWMDGDEVMPMKRVREIGRGAFGRALLVKREGEEELKVLKRIIVENKSTREHLQAEREGKIMKRLVHRNVVKVVAAFTTLSESNGELAFNILQEYCEGGDLSSRVKRARKEPRNPLKQRVVESWFTQICSGLSYIHKNAVIHRDVCAKNIFLCRNDKIVKIGDFGVSKECDTRAMAKTSVGTPLYLSPEIVNGKAYGTKTDMWSVGCVLYELLTLRPPFVGSNIGTLVRRIASGQYRVLSLPLRKTPCGHIVGKLLNLNPRMRPSASSVLCEPFARNALETLRRSHEYDDENDVTTTADEKTKSPVQAMTKSSPRTPPEHRATIVRRKLLPNQGSTRVIKRNSLLAFREKIDSVMGDVLRQTRPIHEEQSPRIRMRRERKLREAKEEMERKKSLQERRRKFFENRKQKQQEAKKCIEEHKARHLRARSTNRKDIKEFIRQRRLDMISRQLCDDKYDDDYVYRDDSIGVVERENETSTTLKNSSNNSTSSSCQEDVTSSFRDVALVKLENDLNHIPSVQLRSSKVVRLKNSSTKVSISKTVVPIRKTETPVSMSETPVPITETPVPITETPVPTPVPKKKYFNSKEKITRLMNLVNSQSKALKKATVSRERKLENRIRELKRNEIEREQQVKNQRETLEKTRLYWLNILKTSGIPLIKFGTSGKPKRRKLRIINNETLVWGGRKKRSITLSEIRSAKRGIRMLFLDSLLS